MAVSRQSLGQERQDVEGLKMLLQRNNFSSALLPKQGRMRTRPHRRLLSRFGPALDLP